MLHPACVYNSVRGLRSSVDRFVAATLSASQRILLDLALKSYAPISCADLAFHVAGSVLVEGSSCAVPRGVIGLMSNSRAARSTMLRCPLSSLHTLEQPRAAPLLTRPLSLEPTAPPAASSRAPGAASLIAAGAAPASSRAPGVVPSSSRAGKAFSRAAAQRGSRRMPPVPRERRRVPPAPARRRAGAPAAHAAGTAPVFLIVPALRQSRRAPPAPHRCHRAPPAPRGRREEVSRRAVKKRATSSR